jgi:hypothetical protein
MKNKTLEENIQELHGLVHALKECIEDYRAQTSGKFKNVKDILEIMDEYISSHTDQLNAIACGMDGLEFDEYMQRIEKVRSMRSEKARALKNDKASEN